MPQCGPRLELCDAIVTHVHLHSHFIDADAGSSPNGLHWPRSLSVQQREQSMTLKVSVGVVLALLAAPMAAQAQGVPGGASHGFHEGNRIAGPVGAVVGTAVGGVIGGVEGVLGINQRPVAYNDYAEAPPPRAYRYKVRRHHAHYSPRRVRHHRRPAPGYVNG
jgi:hypothetical protein